jgi:GNAT superfamily N-acetyltransferase
VNYRFAWAATGADFAALRRLNHDTFASELGQYEESANRELIDRFEGKSRFLLAWREDELAGMIAVHDQPPFSIEQRLCNAELDRFPGRKLEVRLLAVRPGERGRMVLAGLLGRVLEHALEAEYRWLLISGLQERKPFYERLGFRAIAPGVRSGQALYVPMVLDTTVLPEAILTDMDRWRRTRRQENRL